MKQTAPILLLVMLVLHACGNANRDGLAKKDAVQTCPSSATLPHHRINLRSSEAFPAKLAIRIDGVVKFDECLESPVILPAPVVEARRYGDGILRTNIFHMGAYQQFPEKVSFEVLDRKDCVDAPAIFYAAQDIPLEFQVTYPHGVKCGKKVSAELNLIKN